MLDIHKSLLSFLLEEKECILVYFAKVGEQLNMEEGSFGLWKMWEKENEFLALITTKCTTEAVRDYYAQDC